MRKKSNSFLFSTMPFALGFSCALPFGFGFSTDAQQTPKVSRIGVLLGLSFSANTARIEAFRQGLRELGYVEGKNILIEYRAAEGKRERLPELITELVRLKVDVIVTAGPSPTRAAKEARVTIPIVMTHD